MSTKEEIRHIIKTGDLKSWWIDANFIEVYWSQEDLPELSYYLFAFTTLKQDLMSVKRITRRELPRRYKMKKMQPVILRLMRDLIKD